VTIADELDELMREPEEDGYAWRPSRRAYEVALSLLPGLPAPAGICPSNGGIVTEWRAGGRTVRLVVRADEDPYVYFHSPEGSGIEDATAEVLAERMKWFAARQSGPTA
jgi:hypothetical protein